ncbi:MAG: class I SAM-dependent methyltransferase [Acidobacteria bacterium]|nr:class I SAM-dependent methyltransferase [Acidobacteriota bacterium]
MKENLSTRIFSAVDQISRRIHPALLRLAALPVNYQIKSKDNILYESARMIDMAFAYCHNNKIKGDYAEFGVFQGRTTIEAFRASKRFGFPDMRFAIFDSFQGLPEISGKDVGGPFVEGEFSCSRSDYERNLRRFKADLSRFDIVAGFFDETLPSIEAHDRSISIAFIDCDLYESTVPVLEYLTDRLVNGAVLVFDDWYCFDGGNRNGEQLACSEWLERNPGIRLVEYQKFHWAGNSFLVNRT